MNTSASLGPQYKLILIYINFILNRNWNPTSTEQ